MKTLISLLSICAACASVAGCTGSAASNASPSVQEQSHAGHDHAHAEEGPHRGTVIELGHGEYHAEVVVSLERVTLWLLDKTAKREVAVDADRVHINLLVDGHPEQVALMREGASDGKVSCYAIKDRALVRAMRSASKPPVIAVSISGTAYRGEYHEAHQH